VDKGAFQAHVGEFDVVPAVEQADFLKDIDCSEMQGYYFYKPMPVHEFEKIIE
jgi:EAL domain-containing protein (putative c-di-GMP-specific phosphodiesterase class I)